MTVSGVIRYLTWPVMAGLLAGFAVLLFFPSSLRDTGNTINTPGPELDASPQTLSYANAVARAAPSVVNIYTTKTTPRPRHPLLNDPFFRRFFEGGNIPQQQRMESSLGSGVIVDSDGYILTNNHVVDGADQIVVLLFDGREAEASIIGRDDGTDLAVLKIDLDALTPIPIGDPHQSRVGDIVLAIGNPFGVGQSVTQGILSATGRGLGLNTFENFLQTDAAINPGNSGGALIDAEGNLLGINSAILNQSASVGIGFAIPADTAIRVKEDIVNHGRVIRGWLGVQVQQLSPTVAAQLGLDPPRGLLITDVHVDSPAYLAGLLPGDIVTHINRQLVGDGRQGTNMIANLKPGDTIHVQVLRDGKSIDFTAVAGTRPAG